MSSESAASALFQDAEFRKALQQAVAESGKKPEQAEKYARKCLREIEATPRDSWLRPAAKMARFIYTRSYERKLDINLEALEELRELSRDNLLLFPDIQHDVAIISIFKKELLPS